MSVIDLRFEDGHLPPTLLDVLIGDKEDGAGVSWDTVTIFKSALNKPAKG